MEGTNTTVRCAFISSLIQSPVNVLDRLALQETPTYS